MKIKEIMNSNYPTITEELTIYEAIKNIYKTQEHFLIIVKDTIPIGVINSNDIIKALAKNISLNTPIKKVMKKYIATVNLDENLEDAVDMMGYLQIKQLVVTDKVGSYQGLLSIHTLASNFLTEKYALEVILENSCQNNKNNNKNLEKILSFTIAI